MERSSSTGLNHILVLVPHKCKYSTAAAVLKVTEDIIRLSMEDGWVTVLILLDFSQTFDMVVHALLLCTLRNVQNYLVGAGMLLGSYLYEHSL
jgi:hypothetical protein